MYRRAIVNELNEIICWCNDLTDIEIESILFSHPEYKISCIEL